VRSRSLGAPIVSLAMAGVSAAGFAVADSLFRTDADDAFVAAVLLAWTMLVWAALIGGAYAAWVIFRMVTRRSVAVSEAALAMAALAVVAILVVTHPLWGSGSSDA
jgi:Kef-type K+ transport system membrane component KefB